MESKPIWYKPELADEIINNNEIFYDTHSIVTDIVSGRLEITNLVENMAGVLTSKEIDDRVKGMEFFTKLLKEIPKDYLSELEVKFITKFYIDRLKDNHRTIPPVLEGYLHIVDMKYYNMQSTLDFFMVLCSEAPCQSQVRQDRHNIYLILQKLLHKNIEYMKSLGVDFVYRVISAIDGERDPRNLMFLFGLLPTFIANIPLGHLAEEMFEVISCYYPIDFYPSPDDPAAVTRNDLADMLCPCLCASPEFAEPCLLLLIEKLDSSLRIAKLDSLRLLTESCKTFKPESYGPFLKALWSSLHREISNKTDIELRVAAHEAVSALVLKLSVTAETNQEFENFVKGIVISMQTAIAESTTVEQFEHASKVLLTAASASSESCVIITSIMIPAIVAYYEFKTSPKLQTKSVEFLGDLYELAKQKNVLEQIDKQLDEIPQLCLTAVSQPEKQYQISGFKTLIKVIQLLKSDLVVPFVEVLVHNIQKSQDGDVLSVSIDAVHVIARKYPELIMDLVVKGKCDFDNLTEDKTSLKSRLLLLSSLASLDDFTQVIIEGMLKMVKPNNEETYTVVDALTISMSKSRLFPDEKVERIESDYGLIDSIVCWLTKEIETTGNETLCNGYSLIANTMCSLPPEKQQAILTKYTSEMLTKCNSDEIYFLLLESLYIAVSRSIYNSQFKDIMLLCLKLSLNSDKDAIRERAGGLIANLLNKADYGEKFDLLYEQFKMYLSSVSKDDQRICPWVIDLYGWVTKALILRGSDLFKYWLGKIAITIYNPHFCTDGAKAIKLIMSDIQDCLSVKNHCRCSTLYRQRMFETFMELTEKCGAPIPDVKVAYHLSWSHILDKTPRPVLISRIDKFAPMLIDSLKYDDKGLLTVTLDILCQIINQKQVSLADSFQSILPRLVMLPTYKKSMDVRLLSLQCLFEIANSYPTMLLLPYKQDVLLELAPALDDKKRLVRLMAVKARTRWFLVGAPGEAKEN